MALSTTAVTGTVRVDGYPTTATYTATTVGMGSAPGGQTVPGSKSGTASNGALSFNLDRAASADTWMPPGGVNYLITVTWAGQTWKTTVVVRTHTTSIYLGYIDFTTPTFDPDRQHDLLVGEATLPRIGLISGDAFVDGNVYLQYFTAKKTETVSRVNVPSGGTAAAGLTLAKIGVYRVADNGDLTRVGITANTTSLWGATGTDYITDLEAPFKKFRGQRYAMAAVATGTTKPVLLSWKPTNSSGHMAVYARAPRICGLVTSQTDIPETVTAANVVSNVAARPFYGELLPPA